MAKKTRPAEDEPTPATSELPAEPARQYRVTRPLGPWQVGDVIEVALILGGPERVAELVARGALVEVTP